LSFLLEMLHKNLRVIASIGIVAVVGGSWPALAQSVGASTSFAVAASAGVTGATGTVPRELL